MPNSCVNLRAAGQPSRAFTLTMESVEIMSPSVLQGSEHRSLDSTGVDPTAMVRVPAITWQRRIRDVQPLDKVAAEEETRLHEQRRIGNVDVCKPTVGALSDLTRKIEGYPAAAITHQSLLTAVVQCSTAIGESAVRVVHDDQPYRVWHRWGQVTKVGAEGLAAPESQIVGVCIEHELVVCEEWVRLGKCEREAVGQLP
eukprot:5765398-Prymnesium_polylepis.1